MKRFLLIIIVLLVAFTAVVYVFIPTEIPIGQIMKVETSERGINRFILRPENWKAWWPGKPGAAYTFKGYSFSPVKATLSGVEMTIGKENNTVKSKLLYAVTGEKEVELTWLAPVKTSYNPFKRMSEYMEAQSLAGNMHELLVAMKNFLNDDRKVYGLDFKVEKVQDTLVLTTKRSFSKSPETKNVYGVIEVLRKNIRQNKLAGIDSPMLNITLTDGAYQVTAAIPVNKKIAKNKEVYMSELVPGNVLTAKVTGGNYTVKTGLETMKNYLDDHRLISPAIPFQQLITNRQMEKDTSKWVTRLYYPIF